MTCVRHYAPVMLLALSCPAGQLSAQENQAAQWQPVDQTVSDLDLRAASMRRVEQGIGVYGQSGSLYQRGDLPPGFAPGYAPGYDGLGLPLNQQYQLRQPGFTAWLDRPDYLVVDQNGEMKLNVSPIQGGGAVGLIPPNTVFDLVPHGQTPFIPYTLPYDDGWDPNRVSTRYQGVVTGDPLAQEPLPPPRAHRLPDHLIAERKARAAARAQTPDETEGADLQQHDAEASTDDTTHDAPVE
jgi:hypothetical protein